MALRIVFQFQNQPEQVFQAFTDEVVIGRPKYQPIHLDLSPDKKVSRPHMRLYYDMGTWWVEDLNSSHGTYLHEQKVEKPTSLYDGAQLLVGDTRLTVFFDQADTDTLVPSEGVLNTQFLVDDAIPPKGITESARIELLARMAHLANKIQGTLFLEQYIKNLLESYSQASHGGIVLHEDKELVPVMFLPPDQATVSFTLARRAMIERRAFVWSRTKASIQSLQKQSLKDITSAMYAPILLNRRVCGVLYLDTTESSVEFSNQDLAQLAEIAMLTGRSLHHEVRKGLQSIPSVFISYSHRDMDWVQQFAADLRRMPISVWFDERLRGGKEWEQQLAAAIQAVDAFVLVMSPESMQSEYVRWEIEQAKRANKPLFPVMLKTTELPEDLRKIQYLKADAEHYVALKAELMNDLYELLESD